MNKVFQVVTPVSSNYHKRDFQPGETIDMSYASDEDCLAALASGAVKDAPKNSVTKDPQKKEEVKNG